MNCAKPLHILKKWTSCLQTRTLENVVMADSLSAIIL